MHYPHHHAHHTPLHTQTADAQALNTEVEMKEAQQEIKEEASALKEVLGIKDTKEGGGDADSQEEQVCIV